MEIALQTQVTHVKTWLAHIKAKWSLVQELRYLGEKLWQLK